MRPFVTIIPNAATCCALVYVGAQSLKGLKEINWEKPVEVWTTFFAIAVMGFTYSIFNGITFSFIAFTMIQLTLAAAKALADAQPALARFFKPTEGTDCSLPSPIMIFLSIIFVFRYRYLDA